MGRLRVLRPQLRRDSLGASGARLTPHDRAAGLALQDRERFVDFCKLCISARR